MPKVKTAVDTADEGSDRIIVYFAGPMRGLPDFNYPTFGEVEEAWKRVNPDDITLNPARNFGGDTGLPIEIYMAEDLQQLLSAQIIVLLPGWEHSEGAGQIEVPLARATGKIFYLAVCIADEGEKYHWEFEPCGADEPKAAAQFGGLPTINGLRRAVGLSPLPQDSPLNEPLEPLPTWERDLLAAHSMGVRTFETGATRDQDTDKLDYEGFLSPLVLRRFAEYMHKNRRMKDGSVRGGDNWQKGIPRDEYMKSMWRHFMDVWLTHRGTCQGDIEEALCGLLFNAMGYLHEAEKNRRGYPIDLANLADAYAALGIE